MKIVLQQVVSKPQQKKEWGESPHGKEAQWGDSPHGKGVQWGESRHRTGFEPSAPQS